MALTAPPSRKLACSCSVCPARPGTSISQYTEPRHAGQTSSELGSVTIAKSAATPWRAQARPPTPLDSSSVFVQTTRSPARPPAAATASAATTIAAIPPFMSHAPRPVTRPSATCGSNGSASQPSSSRAGTTSMWPLKSSDVPPPAPLKRAAICGRPAKPIPPAGHSGCPSTSPAAGSQTSADAPAASSRPARKRCSAASSRAGSSGAERLVVSKRIRSHRSATISSDRAAIPSTSRRSSGVSVAVTAGQSKRVITQKG